ncbi:MAG: 30S ribosomal protein S16 [Myxococcales bacterium]|nr:30S ribosomal protein S16 [Myxococcales bacterium]
MAVHIRLARAGTKKRPFYRVVVADQRCPRGGRFLEKIGTFDPAKKFEDKPLHIDAERLAYWKSVGATPSATLAQIVKRVAKLEAAAPK